MPRTTLGDRVRSDKKGPVALGRSQELPPAVEEALVQCLEMSAKFLFPMTKRRLQGGIDVLSMFELCSQKSVEMCGASHFLLDNSNRDKTSMHQLQDLVQDYCDENSVETR